MNQARTIAVAFAGTALLAALMTLGFIADGALERTGLANQETTLGSSYRTASEGPR
ncbi:hypothetical protein [Fulvimarina endophytica]|uniref:hypothetical protein n=1 Tax=Fulvimarina endophytica TaxID=2293836 RepID=UPI001314304F|nr:hypothetical protein [Fulvimarina endophytica]